MDDQADVVGWIHGSERHILGAGTRCEITGLVVAPGKRGQGIGRRLTRELEAWAKMRGLASVIVRSNIERDGSHPFYLGLGYARRKTQHVYKKRL